MTATAALQSRSMVAQGYREREFFSGFFTQSFIFSCSKNQNAQSLNFKTNCDVGCFSVLNFNFLSIWQFIIFFPFQILFFCCGHCKQEMRGVWAEVTELKKSFWGDFLSPFFLFVNRPSSIFGKIVYYRV